MKNIFKFLFSILIISQLCANQNIVLEELKAYPKSISRDFYIWQYLHQDISPLQAQESLELIYNMNNKLFFAYANKTNNDEIKGVANCMQAQGNKLYKQNDDCIINGLSMLKATVLDRSQLDTIVQTIKSNYPKKAKQYKILNSSIPFTKLMMSDNDTFFAVFNKCGNKYRRRYFNYKLSSRKLKRLSKNNSRDFETMLQTIITDPNLENMQKSILDINVSKLSLDTKFLFGVNLAKYKNNDQAMKLFAEVGQKSHTQADRDKGIFWQYLITKNVDYLERLANSKDINIYTLYADDIMGLTPQNIVIDVHLDTTKKSTFDTTSPLQWSNVLQALSENNSTKIEYYKSILNIPETKSQYAYIISKSDDKNYFLRPYDEYMKSLPVERKVMINAIARQESRFIPSAVSYSYAQGMMQIMPFLSQFLAIDLKEQYNIFNMFDYRTSIRFADKHLFFLEKSLNHPLFIAYAYNGGIGFTKRMLENGYFGVGDYEPFLSMETVPLKQPREYGKKVLANSVIYRQIYGLPTSIIRVIKTAVSSSH